MSETTQIPGAAVRLAHVSDVHVTARPLGWQHRDWLTKRLPGWFNLNYLGRGERFRDADTVLTALVAGLRQRRPDHVIFSGDASALGFEVEFARAASLLGVNSADALPGLAVPGNHDYYTHLSAPLGYFEKYFAPWMAGTRLEDATYPFAQRVGPLWLVGVNSCTGNRWFWDAAGSVSAAQLERLDRLLLSLGPGLRVLVTHYPVCKEQGDPESRFHRLRDVHDLVAVAARGGIGLWLHGHRHHPYHLPRGTLAPFPIICAGSATQTGVWSYGEYQVEGEWLHAVRRVYSPATGRFEDRETFDLELKPCV